MTRAEYTATIDDVASRAATMTRAQYTAAGLAAEYLDYDLARAAADDRGLTLCDSGDPPPVPMAKLAAELCRALDRLNDSMGRHLERLARRRG